MHDEFPIRAEAVPWLKTSTPAHCSAIAAQLARHRRGEQPSLGAECGSGVPQSRCRCGRGEPKPGADVAGASPIPVQMRRRCTPVRADVAGEPSRGAEVAAVCPSPDADVAAVRIVAAMRCALLGQRVERHTTDCVTRCNASRRVATDCPSVRTAQRSVARLIVRSSSTNWWRKVSTYRAHTSVSARARVGACARECVRACVRARTRTRICAGLSDSGLAQNCSTAQRRCVAHCMVCSCMAAASTTVVARGALPCSKLAMLRCNAAHSPGQTAARSSGRAKRRSATRGSLSRGPARNAQRAAAHVRQCATW